ncbi:MAG: AbrB/MazE/SpoVT family DNA-binding domain-containing protein [Spirochaetales bacterium]|nr:AbrB/MazE/SpoVT family DNA-binding domain-containing protein [Spirochaetales bacterium]MCF7939203.1 AbrB/MazE/SpoVT family DNA-binding domain-containing protein [Spirochaetales bacterium]
MKITLTVTERGTITLPAKLRKEMGIDAESLLIAESTEEGILLRPAVALPVEVYSRDRLGEFAAAEQELAEWYSGESR